MNEKPKPTGLALLREPFPANQISKLPKPSKKQTEELKADFRKGQRCQICGGWHQPDVVHLDYVGHAALTDRLLDVDPLWSWEPMGLAEDGTPAFDRSGGLWIKLTVCGVTRLGYGAADGKNGGDAVKEIIGDALRNAAMRFGAALDLWHKGDLHAPEGDAGDEPEGHVAEGENDVAKQVIAARVTPAGGATERITPEQRATVDLVVGRVKTWFTQNSVPDAAAIADEASFDADEWCYFWTLFDSKQRRALKDELALRHKQSKQREAA